MTRLELLNEWLTFFARLLGYAVVAGSLIGFFQGRDHAVEFLAGGAALLSASVVTKSIAKAGKALKGEEE